MDKGRKSMCLHQERSAHLAGGTRFELLDDVSEEYIFTGSHLFDALRLCYGVLLRMCCKLVMGIESESCTPSLELGLCCRSRSIAGIVRTKQQCFQTYARMFWLPAAILTLPAASSWTLSWLQWIEQTATGSGHSKIFQPGAVPHGLPSIP